MGISEKILEAMRAGFVLNERINILNEKCMRLDSGLMATNEQMSKMNERLIRVETMIEIATAPKAVDKP